MPVACNETEHGSLSPFSMWCDKKKVELEFGQSKQCFKNPFTQPMLSTEFTEAIDATEFTDATLAIDVVETSEKMPKIEATAAKLIADPTAPRLKNDDTLVLSSIARSFSHFVPPSWSACAMLTAVAAHCELPGEGASRLRDEGT